MTPDFFRETSDKADSFIFDICNKDIYMAIANYMFDVIFSDFNIQIIDYIM